MVPNQRGLRVHLKRYSEGAYKGTPLWKSMCGKTVTYGYSPQTYDLDRERKDWSGPRYCKLCVRSYNAQLKVHGGYG